MGQRLQSAQQAKENDTDRQISIAALTQVLFGWEPYTEEKLSGETAERFE